MTRVTGNPPTDFNVLAKMHRDGSDYSAYLGMLKSHYESLDHIPENYSRFIRYNMSLYKCQGKHIVIVNGNDMAINPNAIENGQGSGSEEALIRISGLLAMKGYRVTIFCNVPSDSGLTLGSCNPRYYPMSGLPGFDDENVWVCLAWRRTDWYRLKSYLKCPVIYCPHDWAGNRLDTAGLSGTAFLTLHQADAYFDSTPTLEDIPWCIGGNGYDPKDFDCNDIHRDPLLCGYYSAYHRGLEGVLKVWPVVRKSHPQAKLNIYYGRENWGLLAQNDLNRIVALIESLKNEGVTEMGRVSHSETARTMLGTSLMVNASKFQETYGIVHVKAMAAGVIIVGTDVIDRDLVPPEISLLDHTLTDLESQLAESIVKHLTMSVNGELESLRDKCRDHVKNYTWEKSAGRIADWLEDNWGVVKC